jgi:nucleoid-associated protein YgaU
MADLALELRELVGPAPVAIELTNAERTIPRNLPTLFEQRENKTYYPGREEATSQVLGGMRDDVELEGVLDDRYMGRTSVDQPSQAMALRAALEAMLSNGRQTQLSWGDIVYVGILKKAHFRVLREEMIEYQLTFSVHSVGAPRPRKPAKATPDISNRAKTVAERAAAFADEALTTLTGGLDDASLAIQRAIDPTTKDSLGDLVNRVATRASQLTGAVNRFGQALEDTRAFASRAIGTVAQLQSEAASLRDLVQGLTAPEGIAPLDLGLFSAFRHSAAREALGIAEDARALSADIEAAGVDVPVVHICKGGETLQSISVLYFGTPFRWQDIADFNSLSDTNLAGGDVLLIPVFQLAKQA